jgi:hypothetical protein
VIDTDRENFAYASSAHFVGFLSHSLVPRVSLSRKRDRFTLGFIRVARCAG